mgnify:CR=1 FL=1
MSMVNLLSCSLLVVVVVWMDLRIFTRQCMNMGTWGREEGPGDVERGPWVCTGGGVGPGKAPGGSAHRGT